MIEKLENPFLENDETLICLYTKDIAENTVCDTVNKTEWLENKNLRSSLLKG